MRNQAIIKGFNKIDQVSFLFIFVPSFMIVTRSGDAQGLEQAKT